MAREIVQLPAPPGSKYPFVGQGYQGEKPGWLYHPWTDTYYADPKAQQELAYNVGAAERPKSTSMTDLLLPLTAVAAATTGGKVLAEQGLPTLASDIYGGAKGLLGLGGSAPGTPALEGAGALGTGAAEPFAVGTAANGGTLMSDGTIVAPGMGIAPYLGAAGAGLGAYGLYNATQMNNRSKAAKAGLLSGAGLGAGLGMAAPLVGLGPVGWGTLGLMALGGGLFGGGLAGLTAHESTKEAQQRRWGGLSEGAQGLFAANHPEGDDSVWDTGKYAGQEWTFEKALDLARGDPTHFQGVYGNMAALGDEYFNLSDEQQKEFVRRNIEAGNYSSNKGDVIIQDHNLAQQIKNEILGSNQQ